MAGLRSTVLDAVLGATAGAAGVWAMDQVGWFMLGSENRRTLNRYLAARDKDGARNAGTDKQIRAVQTGIWTGAATAKDCGVEQIAGNWEPDRPVIGGVERVDDV